MNVDTGDAIAHCSEFDKTGKILNVGCSDGEIKQIAVEKGEVTGALKAHEGSVSDLVVSHDNSMMYSVGGDGEIKTWK